MKKSVILLVTAVALLVISFIPWPGDRAASDSGLESSLANLADPATLSDFERGRSLFVAKGCVACHPHNAVERDADAPAIGPNLTYYAKSSPEFLRQWLRDPPAMRPGTRMPNLNLSEGEIEALIAFILTAAQDDTVSH